MCKKIDLLTIRSIVVQANLSGLPNIRTYLVIQLANILVVRGDAAALSFDRFVIILVLGVEPLVLPK